MRERSRRGGVGQVVRGDVDGLNGGDGAVAGGGDTLLKSAHLGSQRRLIADCRRHTAKQSRNLGAGLSESEDIVYEQQDVLSAAVTEVLRDRQAGERHTETRSGRLVHLAEDQCGLVDDAGFVHFVPQVVALAATLADAGEY